MRLQPNEVFPSLESSAPHTVAGLPPAPLTQSILDPRAPDPDGGHKAATRGFCFCSTFFLFNLGSPPQKKSDDAFSRHQDLCLSWKTTWGAYYEQGLGTWLQMKPHY